jgi:hypothetical protein
MTACKTSLPWRMLQILQECGQSTCSMTSSSACKRAPRETGPCPQDRQIRVSNWEQSTPCLRRDRLSLVELHHLAGSILCQTTTGQKHCRDHTKLGLPWFRDRNPTRAVSTTSQESGNCSHAAPRAVISRARLAKTAGGSRRVYT